MTKKERMKQAIEMAAKKLSPQEIYQFAVAACITTCPAEGESMTYRCIADQIREVTGQVIDPEKDWKIK